MDAEYQAYLDELQRQREFLVYNVLNPVYPQYDRERAMREVAIWEPERIEQMYDMVCYMNQYKEVKGE